MGNSLKSLLLPNKHDVSRELKQKIEQADCLELACLYVALCEYYQIDQNLLVELRQTIRSTPYLLGLSLHSTSHFICTQSDTALRAGVSYLSCKYWLNGFNF